MNMQFIDPNSNDHSPFGAEAEFLNSYFCNIIDQLGLDDNVDNAQYHHIELDLSDLYMVKLIHVLISLKTNIDMTKTSSTPEMSTSICKDIMSCLSLEIVFLFNATLQTGVFPRSWAMGTVTVIPKSGKLISQTGDL